VLAKERETELLERRNHPRRNCFTERAREEGKKRQKEGNPGLEEESAKVVGSGNKVLGG